MQHTVEARDLSCQSVRNLFALFLRSVQQIQRNGEAWRASQPGYLGLYLPQLAFGTAQQHQLCTEFGVGECGFASDAVTGTGDQDDSLFQQIMFRVVMHNNSSRRGGCLPLASGSGVD
ncbi:hypothetical protein D3C79_889000 [compost metagenome]